MSDDCASIPAIACWSFVGLRKGSDFEQDSARLNPVHIILVGFGAVVVFVLALIALVNWVVAH